MKKVELLAPAGNLEKLKMAIVYGADAVYAGGEEYGLRANADNFSEEDLIEGIKFTHSYGKKVYITMNIIPHNEDLQDMEGYVHKLKDIGADAVILSDPGVYSIVRDAEPKMEIHLSTQANNTNWRSAKFWYDLGVGRIVVARELSINEIKEIRSNIPENLELEAFVHGAMCISYSGRCLLSNYLTGRDANRGECAHPCRWQYHLVEEKRPGEYMPVIENERGTFIYNSKDLCMINYIPELIGAGISSLKIEGRMKSSFYVATVVKAYREAIDKYYEDPNNYKYKQEWFDEVCKVSHREFTQGFYFSKPGAGEQIYNTSSYIREYDFVGMVLSYNAATGIALVEQRNRLFKGDEIEVVNPGETFFIQKVEWMKNENQEEIEVAPHPQMKFYMPFDRPVNDYTMLRRQVKHKV